jgi:diaminopimelate epimerase
MQGIGNDFVVVDAFASDAPAFDPTHAAEQLCDRHRGVGADGLVILSRGENAPFRMGMFNPDGSESEMCGNATRCIAKLIVDRGYDSSEEILLETKLRTHRIQVRPGDLYRVEMGHPLLRRGEIGMRGPSASPFVDEEVGHGLRGTAISMGNPHLVLFVDDVAAIDLESEGPRLEHHPDFPSRTNVHFVQVLSTGRVLQRTWERGAGVTLACGSGASATAVAGVLTQRTDRDVEVNLPGGQLRIDLDPTGNVWMTGLARTVFQGEIALA